MPAEKTCPTCGKPMTENALMGLCPECLLQAGFGTMDTGTEEAGKPVPFVPPTPDELARYFPELEIIELLGRGGMGAVYKARQKRLERLVAIKILPPNVGQDPSFADRFEREAKALAQLHHPNIVTLYDSGQVDGLFYFFMEFVDGVNLRQLLDTGHVSPKEALAIVPQICDALQFAHDRGIIHRDIKPENILLNKEGRVKIADFGVAKIVAHELLDKTTGDAVAPELGRTEAGKVIGTPQYMAPEQLSHPLEVDNRADIYALGVVFYQMLTGELPAGKFGPPSSKVQIDVRLDDVVLRALQKQPELRYQQASALKTQVETIASTQNVPAIPDPSPPVTRTELGSTHAPIDRYLVLILRWLGVASTVFVLTVLCGAFITYKILPKVYVATAQVQILPRGQANQNGPNSSFDPTAFQAELQIIQSPGVLLPITKDLNLDKIWAKRLFQSRLDALPPQEALAYTNKILKLDYVRGTNIINITASSEVSPEAADIANAVADRYKTIRDVEEEQLTNRGADSLRDQIAQQEKVVDDKKAAVEKIRQDLAQKGIKNAPAGGDQIDADLDARKKDLLAAQEDYDARKVLLDSIINLPDAQFLSTLKGLGRSPDNASDPAHPPSQEQIAGLRRAMQVVCRVAEVSLFHRFFRYALLHPRG